MDSFKIRTSATINLFSQIYTDQTLSAPLGQSLQTSIPSSSEKKTEENVDRKYYSSRGVEVCINDKDWTLK